MDSGGRQRNLEFLRSAVTASPRRRCADWIRARLLRRHTRTGLITRDRQRTLLRETADSLERSVDMIGRERSFAAEDLRRAATSLGRLLGRGRCEDILDVIFRDFLHRQIALPLGLWRRGIMVNIASVFERFT